MIVPNFDVARVYSPWLARQLDNGLLPTEQLMKHLSRPLIENDFLQFADWKSLKKIEYEEELAKQLRLLRRYVVAHIITRDLCAVANLDEVTRTITRLADFSINTALQFAHAAYAVRYGEPIGYESGKPQQLSIVAMGKAGGFELNVSSDIDLIFIYPENGDTNGRRSRTNQEFFTKVGQKLIALLDNITSDGQVFRVDMRLRPDGDSGALVCSEAALEQYLITQGREWERYAWCKGRVVTPYSNGLRNLIRPFVFRKYLDYNAYEAMRGLHRQISSEVAKKQMHTNIKLGAGGIREVEFIAQIFQMIRGGQNRALQLKGTQETLLKLAEYGILTASTVDMLLEAYRFLRHTEHRLQYWDDRQTQTLPESSEQQQCLARSMGFDDYVAFVKVLNHHRENVHTLFTDILNTPEQGNQETSHPLSCFWHQAEDIFEQHITQLAQLGYHHGSEIVNRLKQLKLSSRYRHLSITAQPRFDAIVPRLLEAAAVCKNADETVFRLLDFLDSISRRSSYLVFLQQYPAALKQLAELMSQSAWLAAYLQRHPILLDELISAQLMERLDWLRLNDELSAQLDAAPDTETQMDVLRHFQHAQIFRLAVQDLSGMWTVEALSDELSLLADTVLSHALQRAWQSMPKTHRTHPAFAIIGYGKLGGKELGYTSDLDLVYLYDDPHPDASENYAKLARRLNTWLSGSTGAGRLYDLDLRLRPNGESGFLAHSIHAFSQYQFHQAWTWEHQALSRARFVCGSAEIGMVFEQIRRDILCKNRDESKLKQDIVAMRDKISRSHPPVVDNVKYAYGGVVDVEFIVQYFVLAYSQQYPELLENHGNIALLDKVAQYGLLDKESAIKTGEAYRFYRRIQHDVGLHDGIYAMDEQTVSVYYAQVRRLWEIVFFSV